MPDYHDTFSFTCQHCGAVGQVVDGVEQPHGCPPGPAVEVSGCGDTPMGGLYAWLRWAVIRVGYMIRPYDMLADRRRWRWQPPTRCGWSYGIGLDHADDGHG
jgi:hypothetical protein